MTACPLQAARPLLCPQRSDGDDQNPILTQVAVVSDAGEDHEERRFPHGLGVYLLRQIEQVRGAFVDKPLAAEFDLNEAVRPVPQMRYGIRSVGRLPGFRIDAPIRRAHSERSKNSTYRGCIRSAVRRARS